jgi:hyperosmotically inducible periplasmic protein
MEPIGDYAIHIIVKNGRATLYGRVDNEVDRDQATRVARGVPGLFGVDNQIQVIEPTK